MLDCADVDALAFRRVEDHRPPRWGTPPGPGEGVEVAVAEAAALDEADLGGDAFEAGVGQAELDRGDDDVRRVLAGSARG